MNKHQRKRSRRIKKWMSILNAKGYNLTYRQTKRRMRMFDRTINKWSRAWRYLHTPVCKELAQHWGLDKPRCDGLNASVYIIDENPFVTRYLGHWHYKKENNNESVLE